jgi:hypothetical protein
MAMELSLRVKQNNSTLSGSRRFNEPADKVEGKCHPSGGVLHFPGACEAVGVNLPVAE